MPDAKRMLSTDRGAFLPSPTDVVRLRAQRLVGPPRVAVGDRFEKRGRRVINWQVNAIINPPHGSPIATFAEIGGTAFVQLRVADIFHLGFHRIEEAAGEG